MSVRPLFQLDPRLQLCADLVEPGQRVADIGTDHAYLPVWLARKGLISYGFACDLRSGPLEQAKRNIEKYHVENKVEIRLSDGVDKLNSTEVDTVIIAGMGADVMIHILEQAPWLKEGKTLVLQPMSSVDKLRCWLYQEEYVILEEKAVKAQGKLYSAMRVRHQKGEREPTSPAFPYIGKLDQDLSQAATEYILRQMKKLEKRKLGLLRQGENSKIEILEASLQSLNDLVGQRKEAQNQ